VKGRGRATSKDFNRPFMPHSVTIVELNVHVVLRVCCSHCNLPGTRTQARNLLTVFAIGTKHVLSGTGRVPFSFILAEIPKLVPTRYVGAKSGTQNLSKH
jgi:hypothetical protein